MQCLSTTPLRNSPTLSAGISEDALSQVALEPAHLLGLPFSCRRRQSAACVYRLHHSPATQSRPICRLILVDRSHLLHVHVSIAPLMFSPFLVWLCGRLSARGSVDSCTHPDKISVWIFPRTGTARRMPRTADTRNRLPRLRANWNHIAAKRVSGSSWIISFPVSGSYLSWAEKWLNSFSFTQRLDRMQDQARMRLRLAEHALLWMDEAACRSIPIPARTIFPGDEAFEGDAVFLLKDAIELGARLMWEISRRQNGHGSTGFRGVSEPSGALTSQRPPITKHAILVCETADCFTIGIVDIGEDHVQGRLVFKGRCSATPIVASNKIVG